MKVRFHWEAMEGCLMSLQVKARYLLLAFLPYLIFYFLIQSLIGTSQYNLLMGIDEKIPFIPQALSMQIMNFQTAWDSIQTLKNKRVFLI